MIFGAITMRNWDIDFDRENSKLHFTRADCAKGWDASLNPKHKNRNLEPEISDPRILANVSSQSDLNASDLNNAVVNENTTSNNVNNNTELEGKQEETKEANSNLASFLKV